jgi:hypothetical protein
MSLRKASSDQCTHSKRKSDSEEIANDSKLDKHQHRKDKHSETKADTEAEGQRADLPKIPTNETAVGRESDDAVERSGHSVANGVANIIKQYADRVTKGVAHNRLDKFCDDAKLIQMAEDATARIQGKNEKSEIYGGSGTRCSLGLWMAASANRVVSSWRNFKKNHTAEK